MKNIFEEKKKFDSSSSQLGVFWREGDDLKLTKELSKKVQYSRNQAIKNGLNEAILLMSINEA